MINQEVKELYEEFTFPLKGNHGDFLKNYIYPNIIGQPKYILDAGCGTGNLTIELANKFPHAMVVGVDFSENSLSQARALALRLNIANASFSFQDMMEPFDLHEREKRFDLVVSFGCLHHIPDPDASLRHLRSVITDDGLFILAVYGKYGRIETEMRRTLMNHLREVTGKNNKELLHLL